MALGSIYNPREVQNAIDDKRDFALRDTSDKVVVVTTPGTADQEFRVKHQYAGVPHKRLIVDIDKSAILYRGDRAWDRTYAYLKCSAASTKIRLIFF